MTHPVDEQDDARADEEVVDAVPVPEGPFSPPAGESSAPVSSGSGRGTSVVPAGPTPAQAAAVAVTGFAAGAATVAVVRARKARKAARRGRKERKALGEVRATRSFLVDIHLLGGRD